MTTAALLDAPLSAEAFHRRVRAVRRRIWAVHFSYWFSGAFPLFAAAALVLGVARFFLGLPVVNDWTVALVLWMPFALAAAMTFGLNGSVLALRQAAGWIDAAGQTHDRFATTLDLLATRTRTPMQALALAECLRFAAVYDYQEAAPWRVVPRWWLAALAPLAALGMLCWHAAVMHPAAPSHDPGLDAAVDARAQALAQLAARVRRQDPPPEAKPALDRVADAMKKSAERLRQASDQNDPEKLRAALKEISSLEGMLRAMKQAAQEGRQSPAERQALAAALAASEAARPAADALRKGDLAGAADQLDRLLEQLKQGGADSEKTLQQLAQSMQEQAARLSEGERGEVARQMQQAAQGAQGAQEQLSQRALQRLAELLRRAARQGGQNGQGRQASAVGQGGQPMTAAQMQELINALENMKEGLQPGGDPFQGQGAQPSMALSEPSGQRPGESSPGGHPTGQPGGEHDPGHPDQLFGAPPPDSARPQGEAHRVTGLLGEGESLQQLTGAAGGPARAGRPYRALYEAMAPAAQDSVEQENIPLGSRHFVRRYFEGIRPPN